MACDPDRPSKPCRHLLGGECIRSDCAYSHDFATTTCRFWLQGQCLNFDSCYFLHDLLVPVRVPVEGGFFSEEGGGNDYSEQVGATSVTVCWCFLIGVIPFEEGFLTVGGLVTEKILFWRKRGLERRLFWVVKGEIRAGSQLRRLPLPARPGCRRSRWTVLFDWRSLQRGEWVGGGRREMGKAWADFCLGIELPSRFVDIASSRVGKRRLEEEIVGGGDVSSFRCAVWLFVATERGAE